MENEIVEFITKRLNDKNINVTLERKVVSDINFYRFFFLDDKEGKLVFTLIEDTEESKNSWYKDTHFDGSMDAEKRKEVMIKDPMEESVSEYFKQKFEINNRNWLLRWS